MCLSGRRSHAWGRWGHPWRHCLTPFRGPRNPLARLANRLCSADTAGLTLLLPPVPMEVEAVRSRRLLGRHRGRTGRRSIPRLRRTVTSVAIPFDPTTSGSFLHIVSDTWSVTDGLPDFLWTEVLATHPGSKRAAPLPAARATASASTPEFLPAWIPSAASRALTLLWPSARHFGIRPRPWAYT